MATCPAPSCEETPHDLRVRAARMRGHADLIADDEARDGLRSFAAELEARASAMEDGQGQSLAGCGPEHDKPSQLG